jgi:hypothetical protein
MAHIFSLGPEPATLNSLEEPPETAAVATGRDSGAEMVTSRDSGAELRTSEASGTEPVTSRDPGAEPKASLESRTEAQVSTTTFATAEMDASPVAGTSRASNIRDPVTPDSTSQVSLKNICWLNC